MKNFLSFIGGVVLTVFVGAVAFGTNKVAFVSYEQYSGNSPAYLYYGLIDTDCEMITYTTVKSVHRSITAYSAFTEGQVAGGATITTNGDRRPLVMLWTDGGTSSNNHFHQVLPALKKVVSKTNTSPVTCLAEAKVDKSRW